jgi:hypothetical protein
MIQRLERWIGADGAPLVLPRPIRVPARTFSATQGGVVPLPNFVLPNLIIIFIIIIIYILIVYY